MFLRSIIVSTFGFACLAGLVACSGDDGMEVSNQHSPKSAATAAAGAASVPSSSPCTGDSCEGPSGRHNNKGTGGSSGSAATSNGGSGNFQAADGGTSNGGADNVGSGKSNTYSGGEVCGSVYKDPLVDPYNCGGPGNVCGGGKGCCAKGKCGTWTLYGVSGDDGSSLYSLDPNTGTPMLIGPTGRDGGDWGLAYDPYQHILYGVDGWNTAPALWKLDMTTGTADAIGWFGLNVPNWDLDPGLGFDVEHRELFMVIEGDKGKIFQLNPNSGMANNRCDLTVVLQNVGADFDSCTGRFLFTSHAAKPIYAMESVRDSCEMKVVCDSSVWKGIQQVTGLAWHPIEKKLYAIEDANGGRLMRVDIDTCQMTEVGTFASPKNVEGITFGCSVD